jgi:hypothetical protein
MRKWARRGGSVINPDRLKKRSIFKLQINLKTNSGGCRNWCAMTVATNRVEPVVRVAGIVFQGNVNFSD